MKDNLKVLAVSSMPTVGNAGLKNMLSVLGTYVIPVPSLLISGLGNMEGHQRFELPFEKLLDETFRMAEKCGYELIFYSGYLSDAKQADVLVRAIEDYKHLIKTVIVDPVCGDQGKVYVNEEIIDRFADLLNKADWAVPNATEVRILNGYDFETDLEKLQKVMVSTFPKLNLITTGIEDQDKVYNEFRTKSMALRTSHRYFNQQLSGAGDAFVALFIRFHFFDELTVKTSLHQAGELLVNLIENSLEDNGGELKVDSKLLNYTLSIGNDEIYAV